jgi:serine/threonine protein kinase
MTDTTHRDATDTPSLVPETARGDPLIGTTIDGRYFVDSMLGEGGIGVVYLARHTIIGKAVAIKVLRRDVARDDAMTQRFLLEAQAVSGIGNPHIIDISDFGKLPDGSMYFVMEYLQGQSLADLIERVRPLPVPRLLAIARQVASGLAAAHEAGIVHRDIKPDNVIVLARPNPTSGGPPVDFVKIFDFGIALVGGRASRLTVTGAIFGSPRYMSPEQASGEAVDHRTDIYALGIMMYEMASGRVPFDADNVLVILGQHMHKAVVPLLELDPPAAVPAALDAIIMRCLAKKVADRYASMKELVTDLEKVEQGLLEGAAPRLSMTGAGAPGDGATLRAPPPVADVVRPRLDSDIPIPLTRASSGRLPPAPSTPTLDDPPSAPSVAAVAASSAAASERRPRPAPPQRGGGESARSSGGRWIWAVGMLVVLGVAGVLGLLARGGHAAAGMSQHAVVSATASSAAPQPSAAVASPPPQEPWVPSAPEPAPVPPPTAASPVIASPTVSSAPPPSTAAPVSHRSRGRTSTGPLHMSATVPAPSATAPLPGCDPPYTFDAQGVKRYKRECPL